MYSSHPTGKARVNRQDDHTSNTHAIQWLHRQVPFKGIREREARSKGRCFNQKGSRDVVNPHGLMG